MKREGSGQARSGGKGEVTFIYKDLIDYIGCP